MDETCPVVTTVNEALAVVRRQGCDLRHLPHFADNKDVVLAAVQQNALALKFASPRLKDDRAVVSAALRPDGYGLEHASEELRADLDVVVLACLKNEGPMQFALLLKRGAVLEAKKKHEEASTSAPDASKFAVDGGTSTSARESNA